MLGVVLAMTGCKGDATHPGGGDPPAGQEDELGVGPIGARRLSVDEIDDTLRDLVGDATRPASALLPPDVIDPLDNQFATQVPTATVVDGLEALANDVATRLVADPTRRDAVVGCTPTSAADSACMTSFVQRFGRLALRRALTEDEVAEYVGLGTTFATDGTSSGSSPSGPDFYEGVDVIVRALLQNPEFVYRIELGTPTEEPGVYRLNGYEVATRLSFLLWGSTPDDALLAAAESGQLDSADGIRAQAERLLADDRARDRIDRFHAMWFGYFTLPHPPELTHAFRTETRDLLLDVVFDRKVPWTELFTATGTFADDYLAGYYGLPLPHSDTPVWVSYGDSGRQGLLSHGSFLSVNAKFGDTSPTLRGKLVRERLLCQKVAPPPPNVNVDIPPGGDDSPDCKVDRYAEHRSNGSCKSCHDGLDPIGFGLEAFDQNGLFREHDVGKPECAISGEGELDGQSFVGPGGLADLLVGGDELQACAARQTYRLAMGHDAGDQDQAYLDRLTTEFRSDGRMDQLLLTLVTDEAFGYRREEEVTP